jgi:hypothetical protein
MATKTETKKPKPKAKKEERIKLNMSFEEAIDLALKTPIKKKKAS